MVVPFRLALACTLLVVPLTASAHDRGLDLRYRPASQVRSRDWVVSTKFRPVTANKLTPGSVLAHPIRPIRLLKVGLELDRVRLTFRTGGRLQTVTHAPTDRVLAIPRKDLRASLLSSEVRVVESSSSGVVIRYDSQANPAAGERPEWHPSSARLLILRAMQRPGP